MRPVRLFAIIHNDGAVSLSIHRPTLEQIHAAQGGILAEFPPGLLQLDLSPEQRAQLEAGARSSAHEDEDDREDQHEDERSETDEDRQAQHAAAVDELERIAEQRALAALARSKGAKSDEG